MSDDDTGGARPEREPRRPTALAHLAGALAVVVPLGYAWWEIGLSSLL